MSPPTVAYLRVSSRSQTIATQRDAIERAATARGDRVATWYSETESGKRLARPELERLRRDARGGGWAACTSIGWTGFHALGSAIPWR